MCDVCGVYRPTSKEQGRNCPNRSLPTEVLLTHQDSLLSVPFSMEPSLAPTGISHPACWGIVTVCVLCIPHSDCPHQAVPIPQLLWVLAAEGSLLFPSLELPSAKLRHLTLEVTGPFPDPGNSWQPMTDGHVSKRGQGRTNSSVQFSSHSRAPHGLRLRLNSSSTPFLPCPASLILLLWAHPPPPCKKLCALESLL